MTPPPTSPRTQSEESSDTQASYSTPQEGAATVQPSAELMGMMNGFNQILQQNNELIGRISTLVETKNTGGLSVSLPSFSGNPEEISSLWALQVSEILEAKSVPETKKTNLASGVLKGAALAWYLGNKDFLLARSCKDPYKAPKKDPKQVDGPATYIDFTCFLHKMCWAFPRHQEQATLRRLLRNMKQKTSVQAYISSFRILASLAKGLGSYDATTYFTDGLKPRTRAEVRFHDPQTLEEAMAIAARHDTSHFNPPDIKEYIGQLTHSVTVTEPSTPSTSSSGPYNGPQPMDLNNIGGRRMPPRSGGFGGRGGGGWRGRGRGGGWSGRGGGWRGRGGGRGQGRRITSGPTASDGCYICHSPNHWKNECPQNNRNRTFGGQSSTGPSANNTEIHELTRKMEELQVKVNGLANSGN